MNPNKLDFLLSELARCGALEDFRDLIKPLETYDREHNSDLVKTLEVFFETNANASKASEKLFLHRNSLSYRLERIRQMIGLDLKSNEARLALQLGLLASREERRQKDEPERP